MKTALLVSCVAMAIAAPAAAATFAWTGPSDFDNGESTSITATVANTISFSNINYAPGTSVYNSAGAHSHGPAVNFTINATIDGITQDIYSQLLADDAEQLLVDLGTIHFAGGVVTSIGFGCDACSFNTYHGFGNVGDTTFTLESSVPEAATWTLMIAGFGLVGTAMRRRTTALAA